MPGYKQTEIGVIPQDWKTIEALELSPFITSGSRDWASYYSETGASFLRITNLSRSTIYPDIETLRFVQLPRTETEGVRTSVINGDILVSITADIGIVGYVTNSIPKPAYINQHIACLRISRSDVCTKFLSYFLASDEAQRRFLEITDVGAKTGINLTTIGKIMLVLPPIAEQQAIAEALSDADAYIESLDALIAKKRQIKQGAMQELLTGKTRLPGFEKKSGYKQTEVGEIPEDWNVCELGTLTDPERQIRYGIVQPGRYDPNGRFMIRGQDYSRGWVSPNELFLVSAQIEQRYEKARVKKGDLLITIVGASTGRIAMVPEWLDGANLTQTTARIALVPNRTNNLYCRFILESQAGEQQTANYIKGGAQPGLNCGDVEKFLITIPPTLTEQKAIAEALSDIDDEITALETKAAKARQIKQGMMQELLTGRTRLV